MTLYGWGANSHGQLGLGFASEMCIMPQLVHPPFDPAAIRQICGGGGHCLFVVDSGARIFACGWNNKGQLGVASAVDSSSNILEIAPEHFGGETIGSATCGWETSAALSEAGGLFVWGSNVYGSDAQNARNLPKPERLQVPGDQRVVSISYGLRHGCILTECSTVYVFGKSKCCDAIAKLATPVATGNGNFLRLKPNAAQSVTQIACGQNSVLYMTNRRELFAFGPNKFGDSENHKFSDALPLVASLKSGWTHNSILNEDGRLLLWGRNTYGQLGCRADARSVPVSAAVEFQIEGERTVAEHHMGAEHGLAVTSDGAVFTWGWNEHGSVGNGDTENKFSPVRVHLSGQCRRAGVGGGFCFCVVEPEYAKNKDIL